MRRRIKANTKAKASLVNSGAFLCYKDTSSIVTPVFVYLYAMKTLLIITLAAVTTAQAKIGWTKSKFINTYKHGHKVGARNVWKVGNVIIKPVFDGFGKCVSITYEPVTPKQAQILARKQDRGVRVGGGNGNPTFTSKAYSMGYSGGKLTISKK